MRNPRRWGALRAGAALLLAAWAATAGASRELELAVTTTAAPDRVIIQYIDPDVTHSTAGLRGLEIVPLEDGDDVETAVTRLNALPEVRHVEPDYRVEALAVPDDPRWAAQWGPQAVGAERAWNASTGAREVVVCVTDTGVDYNHPDLAANMDPRVGFDAIAAVEGTPMDQNGHGTHVAGIVAAVGNNTLGVTGVAPRASLLACKFLDAQGVGYMSGILACLDYCVRSGATISVNSYSLEGLDRRSSILRDAIAQAAARDHLFVTAAGNFGRNNDLDDSPSFPAAFATPNMLAVAALERGAGGAIGLASYSNTGPATTHLGAPGSNILSTWPGSMLAYLSGTSMAAPMVGGAAALLRAATAGRLTNAQLRQVILDTTQALPSLRGKVATDGMLNLDAAMRRALTLAGLPVADPLELTGPVTPPPSPPPPPPPPSPPPVVPSPPPPRPPPPPRDEGALRIVVDVAGASCQTFKKAMPFFSSAFRSAATADRAVKIRDVSSACRGPSLSQTNPVLQLVHTMNVRKGLTSAAASVQIALGGGALGRQVAKKFGKLYSIQAYDVSSA